MFHFSQRINFVVTVVAAVAVAVENYEMSHNLSTSTFYF